MTRKLLSADSERITALTGLALSETSQSGPCPTDQQLAAFIDGKIKDEVRETMLGHLNRCPNCYQHWLETATYFEQITVEAVCDKHVEVRQNASLPSSKFSESFKKLSSWFSDWNFAYATVAIATIALLVVIVMPPPSLNQVLDDGYTVALTQHQKQLVEVMHGLSLPSQTETLAFSESQIPTAAQAFEAGLWVGQQHLLGQTVIALPQQLSPPNSTSWLYTSWNNDYQFGRWVALLWGLAHNEQDTLSIIRQQLIIGEDIQKQYAEQDDTKTSNQQAIAALQQISAILSELEQQKSPMATRSKLLRRLEITMQQFGP